jgi:hypothetical protein
MREILLNMIRNNPGIRGIDLVLKIMGEVNPTRFDYDEYSRELTQLIIDDEVVEIEYILPEMEYRVKSIYFPKGTKIASKLSDWRPHSLTGI